MIRLILVMLISMLIGNLNAQPAIQWKFSYGGTLDDQSFSIINTYDGGFMIAGRSSSTDGDIISNKGSYDVCLIKIDSIGAIQWQRSLGGTSQDGAWAIRVTRDSGFIIAGYTYSNDSDVTGNHGNGDALVIKTDSIGNIQWSKCLGGSDLDVFVDVQQTTDDGYILAGRTYSNDGDVSGHHGGISADYWVVKLNSTGSIQWQKCFGGSDSDWGSSVQQTIDSGFIIAGSTTSNDGDIPVGSLNGYNDYWIVKTDSHGNLQWQTGFGGSSNDEGQAIQQTFDSGFIVVGYASSDNGDVIGHHGSVSSDYWVVKLNNTGSIEWQKCLGGTGIDEPTAIQQTIDSGFVISGITRSIDGDVTGFHGNPNQDDYWIVKISSVGNIEWQKCLGGIGEEIAYDVKQTSDLGYIVTGIARVNDGDVTGNHDSTGNTYDFWVVKLSSLVSIVENDVYENAIIYPNPNSGRFKILYNFNFNSEVSVFNLEGKEIYFENINDSKELAVELPLISSGLYIVQIKSGNDPPIRWKLLVEK